MSALNRPQNLKLSSGQFKTLHSEKMSTLWIVRSDNIQSEWLAFLLRIREVPGSNLGPETGYPDRLFVVFLGPFTQMPGYYHKLVHDRFLPYPFDHDSSYHSVANSLRY
jgi:hypothetical protein